MADGPWLVGSGIADVTGDPWGIGMMGYGMRFQRTTGILLRQRSRAFVIADRDSGARLAFVVADIGMFFRNVREAVLARLDPALYRADNVVLTATHTHAGVGGYSCYRLYNMTTDGFQPRTFQAIVDGVLASIDRAEADLAPGRLVLSRGQLHDANVNRSPQSFDRNAATDRDAFPDRRDTSTTLLRLERDGRAIGVVNWFATHGTSLNNRNTLISGDNKGYAAWHWEREAANVRGSPLVAAFAQTNAGDMSPNVPDATCGPTEDDVENSRIIGLRQFDAASALVDDSGFEVHGGIATALRHVRMSGVDIDARWCSDGNPHRTSNAVLGAAFAAGTKEGRGASWCHEGVDRNKLLSLASRGLFRTRRGLGDAQSPKAMLIPVGALGWTADVLPIQLVRIGTLFIVALAQEVTIVAGLRLRRAVAEVFETSIDNVLVQGYANDYAGYLTTPEEYDAQRYEGGHTMFGRWQLPAYLQEVTSLAMRMHEGEQVHDVAAPAPAKTPRAARPRLRNSKEVRPAPPRASYVIGERVEVSVSVPDPRGPLLPVYFTVDRRDGAGWVTVANDSAWSTSIEWLPGRGGEWSVTMTWHTDEAAAGRYRLAYIDKRGITPTPEFTLTAP